MASSSGNNGLLNGIAGRAIARYIKLVHRTSRKPVYVKEALAIWRVNHPAILAFWHGQFLLIPDMAQKDLPTEIMVARHRDAAILGAAIEQFDMTLIRGAGAGNRQSDKGGMNAFRAAVHALADGSSVGMTADVPPGPARRAGMGIVTLAKVSGRPILPLAMASSRYKAFNSWSRLTLNLPFSKLGAWMNEPIFVPADASPEEMERLRQRVEDELNEITRKAYDLAGADITDALPGPLLASLGRPVKPGRALQLYRGVSRLARFAAPAVLSRRARRGKEETARRDERYGRPRTQRPEGPLVWFHAASVGETNTILPLMAEISAARPATTILLTTGTVTSAKLAASRISARTIHQYVPLDVPKYVASFLDHWRPDLAIFAESEIWPNMILETTARGTPLVLVNARMSRNSFRRWRGNPGIARPLFSRFSAVLAQNAEFAERFSMLGAGKVTITGNLKVDVPALPVDSVKLAELGAALGGRPMLLAASTHPGEDEIIAAAHKSFAAKLPGAITIIVPRHPERGRAIADMIRTQGLACRQRSVGELPEDHTDIYVADTLGELGTLYRLAPLALIGGSLVPHGGHNPIEAIRLGAAVLTGHNVQNFADTFDSLFKAKAAELVGSAEELGATAARLLADAKALEGMRLRASRACETLSGALPRTLAALLPLLPDKPTRTNRAEEAAAAATAVRDQIRAT